MAQHERAAVRSDRSDSQPYSKDELVDIIIEKLDKSTEEETLEFHDIDISTAWQTIDELERREEGKAHRYEPHHQFKAQLTDEKGRPTTHSKRSSSS